MLQLLSNVTVGGQVLKNRIVLAPLTRGRCTPTTDPYDPLNTIPNDLMGEYYEQRSTAGLIITEATGISELGSGWINAPQICTEEQVMGWKKITNRVHDAGSIIYLQLWHIGRQTHSSFHPISQKIVSASAIPITTTQVTTIHREKAEYEIPVPLTIDEIKETVQDYVHASKLAAKAGFDGIEIHSANGYLIDQFFQQCSNHRTDMYGGSMENRVRFMEEIIEAIIDSQAFPSHRIGFRLSPNGSYGDMGSSDNHIMFPFIAERMSKYNLAYLHVLDGLDFGYHEKCPIVTAYELKKKFNDGMIICNCGLTKEIGEGMIRSGAADLCAYGRLYMSNPNLPERFEKDIKLNESAPYDTWWYPTGAKGYTDWM